MGKLQLNRHDGRKGSKVKLVWTDPEIAAFEQLKAKLCKNLELNQPDLDRPFRLHCDASDFAIGAELAQEFEGVWKPVGFYSRKLAKSQKNWTPREKETYSIVESLQKWSGLIGFQPVLVTTDHKSLENWVTEHVDTPSGPRGRRARWHERLSQFDLKVVYIPGPENVVPDALSRWAYPATSSREDVSVHGSLEAKEEVRKMLEREMAEAKMVAVVRLGPPGAGTLAIAGGPLPQTPLASYVKVLRTGPMEEEFINSIPMVDQIKQEGKEIGGGHALALSSNIDPPPIDVAFNSASVQGGVGARLRGVPSQDHRDHHRPGDTQQRRRNGVCGTSLSVEGGVLVAPVQTRSHIKKWVRKPVEDPQKSDVKEDTPVVEGTGVRSQGEDANNASQDTVSFENNENPLDLGSDIGPSDFEIIDEEGDQIVVVDDDFEQAMDNDPVNESSLPPPPEKMVFRFAEPKNRMDQASSSSADLPPPGVEEVGSQAGESEILEEIPAPGERFEFAELPPGARRDKPSVIPPQNRSRGTLRHPPAPPAQAESGSDRFILEEDSSGAYDSSDGFGEAWHDIHEGNEWPRGYKLFRGKLYFQEKLCVPEEKIQAVLTAHHNWVGHFGVDRLFLEVDRRYQLPPGCDLKRRLQAIKRNCLVCQASDRPNWTSNGPLTMTLIPAQFMQSVCLDVFSMPVTQWRGGTFDAFLLCVDRHSGWIIAKPVRKEGLTGEVAAHILLDSTWGEVGVPSIVTTDQGSQFANQWFLTICARLGVRVAFSQAHRPRANGRAEVAGRVLQDVLRKLRIVHNINWVEALPRALRLHHDLPDPITKLSPYEIVLGRQRALAGLPRVSPYESVRASDWFERMQDIDVHTAEVLNEAHANLQKYLNARRRERPPYHVGDWVWYQRPRSVGGIKLQSWWQGPFKVVERVGERSYRLRTPQGEIFDAHLDQLKACEWDDPDSPGVAMKYPPEETDQGGGPEVKQE